MVVSTKPNSKSDSDSLRNTKSVNSKTDTDEDMSAKSDSESAGKQSTNASTTTMTTNTSTATVTTQGHANRPSQVIQPRIPVYFLTKGNNSLLIENILDELGWKRTTDRYADFHLRWTESISQINYATFREAEQLINHIPNCGLLTNKLGLLLSLRDFEKRYQNQHNRPPAISMTEFLPTTYIVDDKKERESFFQAYEEDESQIWICKPVGSNQGRGIFMVWDLEPFKKYLDKRDQEARNSQTGLFPRLIQKYITNPLLLDGCKFDIRCYMLIASTMPYLVLYHPGYVRRSAKPYSVHDTNLIIHLTNQFMQKKDPDYAEVKNETVWDMDQFNDYVNENYQEAKNIPKDWVKTTLQWRIQRIIYQVFSCVKNRLASRIGLFELFGLDFMIDEDMKVWLLEINTNPALQTHCDVLQKVVPEVVRSTLHVSIECFEKTRMQKPILPLRGIGTDSNAYMSYNRHRNSRISLDEAMMTSKVIGNLGLPNGWSLIYNESPASLRTRWCTSQSCSLHSWIVPRYRPSAGQPTPTDQNGSNDQNLTLVGPKGQLINKPNKTPGSTSPTRDCPNDTNEPTNQPYHLAIHKQRHSVPEYRIFEQSLRRYPILAKPKVPCHVSTYTISTKPTIVAKIDNLLDKLNPPDYLTPLPLPNSFRNKVSEKVRKPAEDNNSAHSTNGHSSRNKPPVSRTEHASQHREPVRVTTIHLTSGRVNSMTGLTSKPPMLPFSYVAAQMHTGQTNRDHMSSIPLKDRSVLNLPQWPGPLLPQSSTKPKSSDHISRLKRYRRSSVTESGS